MNQRRTISEALDLIHKEFERDRAVASARVQGLQDQFLAKRITLEQFNEALGRYDLTVRVLAHFMKAEMAAVTANQLIL